MTLRLLMIVILLGFLCAGCDTTTVPPSPESDEAELIGDAIDEHTQDLLIAFNVQELLLFELPLKALPGFPHIPSTVPNTSCPTVDDDTDADGDGIPDNAVFTFAGEACTVYIDRVGTFQQSGAVHIVDSGTQPGYRLTFENFRVRHEFFQSKDYSDVTMNGTYDVTATETSARLKENLLISIEESLAGLTVARKLRFNWRADFVAEGAGLVDLSIPLPSGTLSVEGETEWNSKKSFSFEVSTQSALSYSAGCRQGPEFLTGRVDAWQKNVGDTFIAIRYKGCGLEPVITLVTLGI